MAAAQAAVDALPGHGHRAVAGDLASPGGVEDICRQAGVFELLVNNAAIFHRPGSAEDMESAELYRQVNFLAPKNLLEYFFQQDIGEGAAVNLTDAFALLPGSGAYWQSKRDLNKLTVDSALRRAECNFRINAVAPGPMLPLPWAPESRMEKILQTVPLHRRVDPEAVAEMVEFLLKCDSMTGAVIPVDGGISAGFAWRV
jgi:NAD(P)-dependent dehydrogenase (short-subunit alcohol dehydrogenase family)